jgi:hypothetical protein
MKEKLNLDETQYCIQEWVKCSAVSQVKFVSSKKIKSSKIQIIKAPKKYSTLF